jgi:phosphate transport system substrate-binding protein
MMRRRIVGAFVRLGVVGIVAAVVVPVTAGPAHADAAIDGAGSTWVQIALDQWRADVARQGIPVNYQGVGSTSGRVFYYEDQVDFAASEIPFTRAYRDTSGTVITNEVSLARHRPYAYMPDVAGGTSFMYHLTINGKLVTNLRLTPTVIAKIFTFTITNWNDPAIAAENPQLKLPNLPIRPIVRSDGSGTTAQFSAFMASQTADIWNAYCASVGVNLNPCGSLSLWPDINAIAQQFSDGVADYVAAPYNNGAITYVEYGYAKQRGYPVASVLNKAGYFTQPSPGNVAIALTKATLNADLTQNLQGVYTNPDARAYPVSSYSYLIVPTTTARPFSTEKGTTLSKYIVYMVCAGQQKAAQLGYSPLPQNLVQAAFNVVRKIPGHVDPPPISQCANPTISGEFESGSTPPPPPEAKQGATPPPTDDPNGGLVTNDGTGGVVTGNSNGSVNGPTGATGPKKGRRRAAAGTDNGSGGGGGGTEGELAVSTGPVSPPAQRDPFPLLLYVIAAAAALVAIFGPPSLSSYLKRESSPPGPG